MKKRLLMIGLIMFSVFLLSGCVNSTSDYLRIHIRANSNSEIDQNIKYLIKDTIVEYMTPLLVDCVDKDDVINIINTYKNNIKQLIDNILQDNGFNYKSSLSIKNEFFPTRVYDDVTLKADYYDALIINLGSGEGDNWWCVMYPNLCFNEPNNVVYKSKIKEIIERLKG